MSSAFIGGFYDLVPRGALDLEVEKSTMALSYIP